MLSKSLVCAVVLHIAATDLLVGQVTTLAALQDCIGPSGSGSTCQLAPGTYTIPFYATDGTLRRQLTIGRSGINITGTMISGPGDTVLRRGDSSVTYMMVPSSSAVTNVTIKYFTFDGNRYAPGLNCLQGNGPYWDLQLSTGGTFTVQWVDFINAPATALQLGGGSTVSVSNFGQGFGSQSAAQTATRSTAIWIDGSNNGAWYNAIAFAGTAAITLNGTGQYAYGNLLQQNRYEISDGSGGGQIFVSPGSANASVAGNVINGNFWPAFPYPPLATGCPPPGSQQFNAGVEAYGFGHRFYNNEIEQHTGSGMQFAGSQPTGRITISSANPWEPFDTPRYIEANQAGGVVFLGPHENWFVTAQGATLDDVLVRNNAGYGVVLDGVSNYDPSYYGFINGSCMSGNTLGNTSPPEWTTLLYPTPSSYSSYRGGACPDPGWASQTPAPSHIPGWKW